MKDNINSVEEITRQTRVNYEIISNMILDIIRAKGKLNTIYVEFYESYYLKKVMMLFDYNLEKVNDDLIEIYQTIRHLNITSISRVDTTYTTTIIIR